MALTQPKKQRPHARDRHYLAERLRVRAEMQSMGEDEISEVIDERALKARAQASETPKVAKGAVSILNAVDSWPKAFALLVLALLVAFAIWRGAVGILG